MGDPGVRNTCAGEAAGVKEEAGAARGHPQVSASPEAEVTPACRVSLIESLCPSSPGASAQVILNQLRNDGLSQLRRVRSLLPAGLGLGPGPG